MISRTILLSFVFISIWGCIPSAPAWPAEDRMILSDKEPNITINFLGDVILGRTVAMRIAKHGPEYPFASMAAITKDASMTVANLETPLSDRFPPVYKKTMDFISPTDSVKGLTHAGIDLVALANNHSTNYGAKAFFDTLQTLEKEGIAYVGGGKDLEAARGLRIMELNGVRLGFLNYNSIPGSLNASKEKPGVSFIHLKPWSSKDDPEDLAVLKKAIPEAKKRCDLLAVILHWGKEYKPVTAQQTSLAHLIIDGGADLVIGTHPHVAQPVEIYKGKIIAYSLGNFVFDQMQSEETREGYMLKVFLSDQEVTGFQVIPYLIYDYAQPRPLPDQAMLKRVMPSTGRNTMEQATTK